MKLKINKLCDEIENVSKNLEMKIGFWLKNINIIKTNNCQRNSHVQKYIQISFQVF